MLADSFVDRITASDDFLSNAGSGLNGKQRMGEGMVANYMPLSCDLGDDIWPLPHISANQEKCAMNVMLRQNVEQL